MAINATLTIKNSTGTQTVQTFTAPYIFSAKIHLAESIVGNELSYDTATFVVTQVTGQGWGGFITTDAGELYTAGEQFMVLGDEMEDAPDYPYGYRAIFDDGVVHFVFYVQKITRIAKYNYQIDCISAVGLLSTMDYDGGLWLYTAPTTVQALLNDILSGSGVSFSYDPTYANQSVSGWIPICTRREAIQQVLFATGLNLIRQSDGSSYVTGLDASTSTAIADNRVYYGGRVIGKESVSKVVVVEHDYVYSTETEEIFSGDITEANTKIVFDKPYHDVVAVDGNNNPVSITAYTNYCIVANPTNNVTITGQMYIDNTTEINIDLNHDTDKVARVDKATLVNIMNAEGVASRISKYFSSASTVESAVVYEGTELPGDNILMNNAWGEEVIGLISQMDVVISAVNKATLKVVTDYIPGGAGNLWEHAVVLDSNQTWTVPASNTSGKIKVIIIQGGDAGQNGFPGEDGKVQTLAEFNQLAPLYAFDDDGSESGVPGSPHLSGFSFPAGVGEGGDGGAAGAAGVGGKIAEYTLDVSHGDTIAVTVGAGGVPTPIVSGGEMGGAGGESTVVHNGTTYSSASGVRSASGFVSYMLPGSPAYGKPGAHDGVAGAKADGSSVVVDPDGNTWKQGASTSERFTVNYATGQGGTYVGIATELCPSRGGGGAVGNDGNAGGTNVWEYTWQSIGYNKVTPGNSGDGATPIQAASGVAYGDGGCGGHGGGGGGGKGDLCQYRAYNEYARIATNTSIRYSTYWEDDRAIHVNMMMLAESAPGQGGSAGLAGAGAQGCVIIYY